MFRAFSPAVLGLLSTAAVAEAYRCVPVAKHLCTPSACVTETEGFQHAEIFFYNSDGLTLGACLWTNCYTGNAHRFVATDGEQATLIGQLQPDHSPEMYAPLLVSLTVDKNMAFTAIWRYSGSGLTIDHGKCEKQSR